MAILKFIVAVPFAIIVLVLQLFFVPYAIVSKKRQYYPGAKLPKIMFILVLVFGWTVIGWFVLLGIALILPR